MGNTYDTTQYFTQNPGVFKSFHSAAAGTMVVSGVPALLHTVTINKPIPNGTTTLFDCAGTAGTASTNIIANIVNSGTTLTEPPLNGVYDVRTNFGLVIYTSGAQDVNVSYLP